MTELIDSRWLFARSNDGREGWAVAVVYVGNRSIFAELALTAFGPLASGDDPARQPWAGVRFSEYVTGNSQEIILPVDYNQNTLWVANCSTFHALLYVNYAWAYGRLTVWAV